MPQYTGSFTIDVPGGVVSGSMTGSFTPTPPVGVVSPVADFTGTPLSGTTPLSVVLTDASTNTPTSWLWETNLDGAGWVTRGTSQNPTISFAAGTSSVRLTATNAAGSDTKTRTNYVVASQPAPTVTGAVVSTDGVTWTLTLSQACTGHTGFVPTIAGVSSSFTYVSGDGTATYVFTAAATAYSGQTCTLAYTAGDVTDGTPMANFTGAAVTNNSTQSSFATLRLHNVTAQYPIQPGCTVCNIPYASSPGYGWLTQSGQVSTMTVPGVVNTTFWNEYGYLLFGSAATFRVLATPGASLTVRLYYAIVGATWSFKVTPTGGTVQHLAADSTARYVDIACVADGSGFIDLVCDKDPTTAAAIQGFDVFSGTGPTPQN